MTDQKQQPKSDIVRTIGAGLLGAAAGAGAVMLSNKRNRDTLKKTMQSVAAKGEKKMDDARKKVGDALEEAGKNAKRTVTGTK